MAKKIVLIDGDEIRRSRLRHLLSLENCDVTDFAAGRPALGFLLSESVSAIVLDYSSPYDSENTFQAGQYIVQEITNIDAFVPLILICDRFERLDCQSATASDLVLRRPLSERQLMNALATVLEETLRERVQRKSRYIFAVR